MMINVFCYRKWGKSGVIADSPQVKASVSVIFSILKGTLSLGQNEKLKQKVCFNKIPNDN